MSRARDRRRFRLRTAEVAERVWAKIERRDGHWIWVGALAGGYGTITVNGRNLKAHRAVYELLVEPIPPGFQIDHLCRVRACVNPAHLEPVTPQINQHRGFGVSGLNARKDRCPQGHEYDRFWCGRRYCSSCSQENRRAYRRRRAAA